MIALRLCLALFFSLTLFSCDEPAPVDGGVDAAPLDPTLIGFRFETEGTDFYGMPWPSDARLLPGGQPDMSGFPSRRQLLDVTLTEIETNIVGFATMPVIYFGLTAPVSADSIPQGLEAQAAASTLQLMDLSVEGCGERFPLEAEFQERGDTLRGDDVLQVANAVGTLLTPGRPYGLIVLRTFGTEVGRSTPRPDAFDAALMDTTGSSALATSLEPLRRCLPGTDVSLDDVAVATVFTPQDPVREARVLRDFVMDPANVETRAVADWHASEGWSRRRLALQTYEGVVQMPMFQEGVTPYETEGGALSFTPDGRPQIERWEDVDIAVAYRTFGTPPVGPRPVLVFADGTGWTPWSHLRNNWITAALDAGYVVFSFMPQFHGERAGFMGNTEISSFNIPNPPAGRANFRQQSTETSYFIRLIREQIRSLAGMPELDTANMVYGGHSQGALVGSMVAAVEDQFRAYVVNGLSAYLTFTILFREDLLNFRDAVSLLYNFSGELDRFHPLTQIIQLGAEVVDPHNYASRWRGSPDNPGGANVFVSNGFEDSTTTPRGIEQLTLTGDIAPIEPPGWEIDPVGVSDLASVSLPISGNEMSSAGDPLTIATYLHPTQGHFTIYRIRAVREMAINFWDTARAGAARLYTNREFQCGDGADEDEDTMIDCADPDCVSRAPCVEGACDNMVDEDSNGLTDCADPVCAGDRACLESMCDDGVDNDSNGDTDCADANCQTRAPCAEGVCDDSMDGDGDGDIDCADSDCDSSSDCRESCTDERDNDADGDVDCADSECTTSAACPELMCTGGADEDGNGLIDCGDPGCGMDAACVVMRETVCDDTTDNDFDGDADCADADCALEPTCAAGTCADGDLGSHTGVAIFTGTLEGRANSYPPADCTPLGAGADTPDIALAWTAPAAGDYIISTYGSMGDTVLSVHPPDCSALTELACDDDDSPLQTSSLRLTVADAETVVIVIGAYDAEEDALSVMLHVLPAP